MNPVVILFILVVYFTLLIVISAFTSKNATNETFFTADRRSRWYLVAFGMIGTSLSGVTFISVPGEVGNSSFYYFQVVLGYIVGYAIIANVLMPMYYRLNLITIYTYLEQRFGFWSYKTGAFFFLVSRTIGSALRMFLVAGVLQIAVFDHWKVPFWVTVLISIILIWIYTYKGGIKTVIWTDTLQTVFMLTAVVTSIYIIKNELSFSLDEMISAIDRSSYSNIFNWEWNHPRNFFKQFFSGAFIAIVMTGLDQDMMQKNLTCRSLGEAQKNMYTFTATLVFVNFLFLSLGALLYIYSASRGIALPERSDYLFPTLAIEHFSAFAGTIFIIGITAANYASADSALAALTTSFCVDFLGYKRDAVKNFEKIRIRVHLSFSFLIFLIIIIFRVINDESVINAVFTAAGYTYGPLLGLFSFGMFTRYAVRDKWVPLICLLSPIICYVISLNSESWFNGYKFGFELLILNGAITFLGLWLARTKTVRAVPQTDPRKAS
ncbi:MAG TPA: sodium:solute symporter [Cyclobacteriaceae bacterium]|nr:sodium:solute symporter [Cyclobacteriaceae bacterium]